MTCCLSTCANASFVPGTVVAVWGFWGASGGSFDGRDASSS